MKRKIIKIYQYLFYKLYNSLEKYSSPRFWSEWKASLLLILLLFSIFYSLILYYEIFIDKYASIGNNYFILFSFIITVFIINYNLFLKQDKWKNIVRYFDKLSVKKQRLGSVIFILFCLGCIVNFVYAFYLFSKVDWSLYK